ncbi:hypothetical protein [uncultured Dokdonia sp.]|uniref:hypothetical protein n=1 Tax=uncultured Dokdonia sp. TaxID=575653 RepID=UPI0026160A2A|nr:hypothetical protein [uncultured Dokdonia sp.]
MKKQILLLSVFASAFFVSCSDEEIITSNDAITDFEVTIEQIEQIDFDPETAEPNNRFNDASEGLYHGVIVTVEPGQSDNLHGKIWININNDGHYNATVVTNQGDRFKFLGKPVNFDNSKFVFRGKRGTFDYDISDINNPVATNVIVDSKPGHVASVKDRAGQRAAAILGTFATNDNPDDIISGTWDLLTDGTPNPDAFNFPLLTEVVITVTNNGNVYSDTDFEMFNYLCFFETTITEIAPVFLHEDPMTTPNGRNEFWAQNQSFQLGNATLEYWLGQSSGLVDSNGSTFVNHGFHNSDFADPPSNVCTAIDGQKGIWTWNGRTGTSSFDDPFDVPMLHSENVDYEAFKQVLRQNN